MRYCFFAIFGAFECDIDQILYWILSDIKSYLAMLTTLCEIARDCAISSDALRIVSGIERRCAMLYGCLSYVMRRCAMFGGYLVISSNAE